MKLQKSLLAARIISKASRSSFRPMNSTEEDEGHWRISSLRPQLFVLFALIGAASAFSFAIMPLFSLGSISWTLFVLGTAQTVVALAGFVMWKHVRRGPDHFHVSDFIRSETISFVDVCMVVEGHGVIWNTSHIHFRRLTRFGWSVSYVPIRSGGRLNHLLTAAQCRGAPNSLQASMTPKGNVVGR